MNIKSKLILALDVEDLKTAKKFINLLAGEIKIFKIGPVLFTAYGPKIIDIIHKKGCEVFLDLKFHDIPNTVAHAIKQAVKLKVKMLTLHTCGGQEMMQKAAEAAKLEAKRLKVKKPLIVGVTVLTSDKSVANTQATVLERAKLAKDSGLDGVVCSVLEAEAVSKTIGKDFIIVTPGIRPKGSDVGDQKRVATPIDAINAGASYLVVGRPILEAVDPVKAVKELLK